MQSLNGGGFFGNISILIVLLLLFAVGYIIYLYITNDTRQKQIEIIYAILNNKRLNNEDYQFMLSENILPENL
jgi:H+/Cl- antiporter ClcA